MEQHFPSPNSETNAPLLAIFDTPHEIIRRILKEEDCDGQLEDLIIAHFDQRQTNICDFAYLYIADRGVMPAATSFDEQLEFVDKLQKIRGKIRDILEINGAEVWELQQTCQAAKSDRLNSTNWIPAKDEEKRHLAYKVNFYPINEHSPYKQTPIVHDSLATEVILPIGNSTVSIAPFMPRVRDLHDFNEAQSKEAHKLKFMGLISSMEGGIFLHQQGIIHGDIKPANILLLQKSLDNDGNYQGKICDLEGMRKVGNDDQITTTTPQYSENMYYAEEVQDGKKIPYPQDTKKDIFSWGITILELASNRYLCGKNGDLEMIMYAAAVATSNWERERNLHHYIASAAIPKNIKKLLKRMTCHNRESRPELQEVMEELKKTYFPN